MSGLLLVAAIWGQVEVTSLSVSDARPFEHVETHHVQGLAADTTKYFVSSVERGAKIGWMFVVDRVHGRLTRSIKLALGEQYHPGGMQLRKGELFVPLAEYRPQSTATILVVDASTLRVKRSMPVDDHIGAVGVADDGTLFAANWDAKKFHILDSAGKAKDTKANPTGVAYQDIEWHEGALWCSGNAKSAGTWQSVVDVIDVASWKPAKRYVLTGERKSGGSNFGQEGFTRDGDRLLLLPEDGPKTTVYSFLLGD